MSYSMALDYEEYVDNWKKLASSMPSDTGKNIYRQAILHNDDIKYLYPNKSRK